MGTRRLWGEARCGGEVKAESVGGAGRELRGEACANRRLGIDAAALEARLGAGLRGGPGTELAGPKQEELKEGGASRTFKGIPMEGTRFGEGIRKRGRS